MNRSQCHRGGGGEHRGDPRDSRGTQTKTSSQQMLTAPVMLLSRENLNLAPRMRMNLHIPLGPASVGREAPAVFAQAGDERREQVGPFMPLRAPIGQITHPAQSQARPLPIKRYGHRSRRAEGKQPPAAAPP